MRTLARVRLESPTAVEVEVEVDSLLASFVHTCSSSSSSSNYYYFKCYLPLCVDLFCTYTCCSLSLCHSSATLLLCLCSTLSTAHRPAGRPASIVPNPFVAIAKQSRRQPALEGTQREGSEDKKDRQESSIGRA